MAQQINSVVLGGNLTRDPELRTLPSGTSVANLRIANNRRRKRGDEWGDEVGYYDVTVWGKQAENCAEYLEKGRQVLVAGNLHWREWEAKDGTKRQAVEINAREVQFVGGRGENGGGDRAPHPAEEADAIPADTADFQGGNGDSYGEFEGQGAAQGTVDDDIPF